MRTDAHRNGPGVCLPIGPQRSCSVETRKAPVDNQQARRRCGAVRSGSMYSCRGGAADRVLPLRTVAGRSVTGTPFMV